MGLDVALGAVVLIAGVRGYLKGFVPQAIGLLALVSSIYLADPIRDFARPHAVDYLPAIRPELLDKLLWWCSALAAFLTTAGLGKWLLKAYRRRPYGEPEPNRGDQGAGFVLRAAKGAIVVAFLTAAMGRHSAEYLQAGGYAEQQVETSKAVMLEERFKPADRIWASPPVQSLVARVRSRGLWTDPEEKPMPAVEPSPVRTAERPKALALPSPPPAPRPLDPNAPDFLPRLDDAFRKEGLSKSR